MTAEEQAEEIAAHRIVLSLIDLHIQATICGCPACKRTADDAARWASIITRPIGWKDQAEILSAPDYQGGQNA